MHAAGSDAAGAGVVIAGVRRLGIAEGDGVHAVDGNLVFCDKVALDRFGQTLGTLNADAACRRGVRFYLEDVALLAGDGGRQIVKLLSWPLRTVSASRRGRLCRLQ